MSAVTQLPVERPVVDHPVGRRRWNAGRIARVTVMAVVAAMFVIPIVGFIAMAFRNQAGVAADSDGWLGLQGMSWDNVVYSWSQITGFGPGGGGLYQRWILNSLILAVAGGVLALDRGPSRRLRPRAAAVRVAQVLAVRHAPRDGHAQHRAGDSALPRGERRRRSGTALARCRHHGVLPVRGVPQLHPLHDDHAPELVEAARIDGLGEIAIFFRVGLPISKQAVALVAFFSFVANWTNFFLPLALLTANQQNKTISIGIQELIGASPLFNATVAAGLDVKLYMPQLALATVISMIPLLIVFLGAQRFLIRGQTVGAVKG